MKKLFLIGGTMGVGKTAVSQALKSKLDRSVFLDGDWCWDAHPFTVTEETKAMVLDNICYLLNQFIRCTAYDNIIFCWVMHEQAIIDTILGRLDTADCEVKTISLVCGEKVLRERLVKDVKSGIRSADVLERSVGRIPLYDRLQTIRIDTGSRTIDETAELIAGLRKAGTRHSYGFWQNVPNTDGKPPITDILVQGNITAWEIMKEINANTGEQIW